jgi:signal transduction histidine kinase
MTVAVPIHSKQDSAVAVPSRLRSRLFVKYVALIVAVVSLALLTNGLFELWFSYQEHKASLIRIQHEQAESAAAKIGQFIKEIESQVGWTTQLLWSAGTIEQHRFDALRLLRQVPAITELAEVDAAGKERLRVSRLAMDVVGSGIDLSKDPKFIDAVKNKVYYGPVYFRRESEPYMTLALAGTRRDAGVSIAEVNLKFIWDVVSKIKVGERGHAYVVDAKGRLIAHPDISLVLRNTDMNRLAQVRAARKGHVETSDEEVQVAQDLRGRQVLTAYAPVAPLAWTVFVELPVEEAYAPLFASVERTGMLLFAALCLAALAGMFLARRMVVPVQVLRAGAARIGSGDLAQRISVKTGDELEALGDQFNDMAERLQESYADLEKKVDLRTRELTETLEQQTATGEILASISGSMTDTKPVFDAIVRNLLRLFGTRFAVVQLFQDGMVQVPAVDGEPGFEKLIEQYPRPLDNSTGGGLAMLSKQIIQFSPVLGNPAAPPVTQEFARNFGFDSVIFAPMIREDKVIGAIATARREAKAFDDKQVALIKAFADQAVIAIENVRLFESVQARTRELVRSLEELRTTQDRLVQTEKLASLGQLTAGIAHEIKNPLNFVNNFSAISVELVDELRQALAGANLNDKLRAEISEIADMLQVNLDKVVQHGKRADSIVRNMLLHSRQGSGEHRPIDINTLVEESLNLAYHGARAETQDFNITLERSLDPAAGEVDLFPQDITRVLLNLISNGFYAATKRKGLPNNNAYEPTLTAATRNLGDSVEIKIRDNGTGIPPEVKDKMFNPFFTTKPAGEGTGLGLSISHDIIVKQHAGSIEVDTKSGEFTEFRIILPRTAAFLAKSGGRA